MGKRTDFTKATYSTEDVIFLEKNYTNLSNKELADSLGRTENSIALKLSKLKLIRQPKDFANSRKIFTKKEIEYVQNNYSDKSLIDIANELERSYHSINRLVTRLGLNLNTLKIINYLNQYKSIMEKNISNNTNNLSYGFREIENINNSINILKKHKVLKKIKQKSK